MAKPSDGPTTPRTRENGATLVPGLEAGVLGGVAMAAWMAASAAVLGMDPLAPLAPMGDTFASAPREPGAARAVYGIALHLIFSGVIGVVLIGVLPADLPARSAVVVCTGLSWAAMGVMTSSVLPAVNPSLRAEMPDLGGSWVLAHAAYGATVGFLGQRLRQRARAPVAAGMRTRAA